MKPNIINVSLNNKLNNLSYPIFIGNELLYKCVVANLARVPSKP